LDFYTRSNIQYQHLLYSTILKLLHLQLIVLIEIKDIRCLIIICPRFAAKKIKNQKIIEALVSYLRMFEKSRKFLYYTSDSIICLRDMAELNLFIF
jgi:hypothetical protein